MMDNHRIPGFNPDGLPGNQAILDFMAVDIYIYGYPLVLMDVTKRIMLAPGLHLNQFINERAFPTPQYTTIVRPNVDTLYSMAWLDLSREPIILKVPDTHQRYYLMEFLDAWTNVFASIGVRTTGTRAGAYAITGPEWNGSLPEGIIRIGAPTNTVWIIGRTQTNGPQDYQIVHTIQNNYSLIPLSCREKLDYQYPSNHSNHRKNQQNVNPVDLVAGMDAVTFFQTMMRVIAQNPAWIEDPEMNQKLAALGLIPNQKFDFQALNPAVAQALQFAALNAPRIIQTEAVHKISAYHNNTGWILYHKNMGFYGVDYLQRAIVAMSGIGANLPQDSVYAPAFTDVTGRLLTGSNNYLLHFDPGQFPPVNAFWSITVYNEKGYLVENPIHRYALSPHLHRLNYNSDDSLEIFIGSVSPGKDYWNNWLPVPEGRFNLMLRMYWPKQSVLDGTWTPPAIKLLSRIS